MKAIIISIFAFGIFWVSHKVYLGNIVIRKFQYSIYQETIYSHDDNWKADYFTVYLKGSNKRLCSSYFLAKRSDTIFINGNYTLYKDKLEFTQRFYHKLNNNSADSIKTVFTPNKNGDLVLVKTEEYKDGKSF
jgi:hypothetical protein